MSKIQAPLPLFDTLDNVENSSEPNWENHDSFCKKDYQNALSFIVAYNGSQATFNAYRREVERLLHWSWLCANKSIRGSTTTPSIMAIF